MPRCYGSQPLCIVALLGLSIFSACHVWASPAVEVRQAATPFRYQLFTADVLSWGPGKQPKAGSQKTMAQALQRFLQQTSSSLELAAYGFNKQEWILDSLLDAEKRGIRVQVVVDQADGSSGEWLPKNFTYAGTAAFGKALRFVQPDLYPDGRVRRSSIMHNKFILRDQRKLWFGSANLSHTDIGNEYNANLMIEVDCPRLSHVYSEEFLTLFAERQFSTAKQSRPVREIQYTDGTRVRTYFSPQDQPIQEGILPLMDSARLTIDVAMFFLTHDAVVAALARAVERGVAVRIITDANASAHSSSKVSALRQAGIDVRVENWPGKMHMKTAVVDSVHTVIGSMNWSQAGEQKNDETTSIIFDHPSLAQDHQRYFETLWQSLRNSRTAAGADARAESRSSPGSCTDGIDNDHDGLIDDQDPSCSFD